MEHEYFSIEIGSNKVADAFYADLLGLEVELDEDLAGQFRLRLALSRGKGGRWRHLDDGLLAVWQKVSIRAGFKGGVEELIEGYITHLRPAFGDEDDCLLEVWGLDRSVLLDREEKLKSWPNKKDSDIAQEIFGDAAYKLSAEVEDTRLTHDEVVSTILQRETDMRFLKRLAVRNGYECYVEGGVGYFRPPRLNDPPQPTLALHFGPDETNVVGFAVEVNALAPAELTMWQIDRMDKSLVDVKVQNSRQKILGRDDATQLPVGGVSPGLTVVGQTVATGRAEMEALCQGLYHQAEWFVTGEGEVNANRYGHVLKPRLPVTIKGIGETYSGVYYVSHVTHRFTKSGYSQHFRVRRNGLMPAGTEPF